ncbi:MAG: zinc dependent phospholipase C family protein [Clostridia bacterium]|nr:zinc dependent phospholipase C family protein [Clostridia bacterium]
MPSTIENAYGKVFRYTMSIINPFKKAVIQTECKIHQLINIQAIEILKNDAFLDAHNFFSDYLVELNAGVVWADQDLKSANHFYNPVREKGLYGNRDALSLALEYYDKSLSYWKDRDVENSIFYLGATVHLVQDMTVPQHANIRLLDDHRQYENFIRKTYLQTPLISAEKGGYYIASIREAIRCNARNAIRIYSKLKDIRDDNRRFHTISKFTLPLAQKTTAGCLMRFYKDAVKLK